MPAFNTPEPISVMVELVAGDVRFTAAERPDTVVQVRPSDPTHDADVRAAQQTRVEYASGRLLVRTPRQRGLAIFGRTGSVEVTIDLPAGSQVEGSAQLGNFRSTGQLGDCRFSTQLGDLQLDHIASLDARTGSGGVAVERVDSDAVVSTGSGKVRLGEVGGRAVVKNSNGDNRIGRVAGDLRVHTANGDISVQRAESQVVANSANGNVRVGVVRGSVLLRTARGEVEIFIPAGTSARMDVHTNYGRVRNQLTAVERPEAQDETAEVRARTSYGDIVIRRA